MNEHEPEQSIAPGEHMSDVERADTSPLFSVGDEVVVERNARDNKPAYFEGGWKVIGIDALTNRVIVSSPDGEAYKHISPELLQSFQPTIELDVSTEEKFKIGDIVTAPRNMKDAEGRAIKGKYRLEPGWRVVEQDAATGTVIIESPDGIHEKTMSTEKLEVYQSLGGVDTAAEAARYMIDATQSIGDRITALTENLSDDDRNLLNSYANADEMVKDAQREGRGSDSTYWQQVKGQAAQELSSAAKEIADQYAVLYKQWTV